MMKIMKGISTLLIIVTMADGKCTMEQVAYTTGFDAGQFHADKDGYEANYMTASACQSAVEIYSVKQNTKPNKQFSSICKSGAKDGLNGKKGAKIYKSECTYF